MSHTPPPRPLFVPELLRQASQRLAELADRAEQLASIGVFCANDPEVERASELARQVLDAQ